MDSRKPLTSGEIEELKGEVDWLERYGMLTPRGQELVQNIVPRLLSMLTPPPDAAVREAVERCTQRLTDAERVEEHPTLLPCDLLTLLRAVQAPRLTTEQVEAVRG